jgi:3-methyladenine DNA glycosylase AlkD
MTVKETMERLKAAGSEQTRAIYTRHGAGENQFGVKYADLGKLRKEIGTDHDLAKALWATGNSDARALAVMIADPNAPTAAELDSWAADISYYGLAEVFARFVAKSPHANSRMTAWIEDDREYVAQTGWTLLAISAAEKKQPDAAFELYLARIERDIHSARNRVRHAMNNALIAIGIRSDALRKKAEAAAKRIGKVEVDHGETGCVTPDAAAYIKKVVAYKAKKATT